MCARPEIRTSVRPRRRPLSLCPRYALRLCVGANGNFLPSGTSAATPDATRERPRSSHPPRQISPCACAALAVRRSFLHSVDRIEVNNAQPCLVLDGPRQWSRPERWTSSQSRSTAGCAGQYTEENTIHRGTSHLLTIPVTRLSQLHAPTLAAHLHGVTTGLWTWTFPPQEPEQSSAPGAVEGTISTIAPSSDQQLPSSTSFHATLITSPALLSASTRTRIFDLFQRNLQSSYELNDAWSPAQKKEEIFDVQGEGRWILLWELSSEASQVEQGKEEADDRTLVGFILWRFDTEECTKEDWTEWEALRQRDPSSPAPAPPQKRVLPLPGAKRGPGGKGRLVVKRPKVERILPVGYW